MKFGNFLVLGSLCAHPDDREMSRGDLVPVWLFAHGELIPLNQFNSWGSMGVSSLAFQKDRPELLWATTGDDLIKLNLENGTQEEYDVPELKDVHEMLFIERDLWLANTSNNELVKYDISKNEVSERINLLKYRMSSGNNILREGEVVEDVFHTNAVFKGLDGNKYALVHHYSGRQKKFFDKIKNRFLKEQGDGGVINLETGKAIDLKLTSPHTPKIINSSYWIFSSGDSTIDIFDREWNKTGEIQTAGFGRGGDRSLDGKFYFAATSATRKRYRERFPDKFHVNNMIEIFDVNKRHKIFDKEIPGVEQINNVYSLTDGQTELLRTLEAKN